MLRESARPLRNTSWKWLESDGTDGLAGGQIVGAFDYDIWTVYPDRIEPTGATFVPSAVANTAVEGLLRARLRTVVAALPHNDQIIDTDVADPDADSDAEDHLNALPPGRQAVMNAQGFAQPVAAVAAGAMAGTNSVAPCVAVLGRVQLRDGRWRVGCTHLSSRDMATFHQAGMSVGNLLAAMAPDPAADNGPVQLYAVGGRADRLVSYQELGRLVGAIQQLAHDRGPGALQLAGAKLPANRAGYALAVLIGSDGVEYTSDPSDGSDQSSSEGDGNGDGGTSGEDQGSGDD